jgi:hypothetical protein
MFNTPSVILYNINSMKTLTQFSNFLFERMEAFTQSFANLLS